MFIVILIMNTQQCIPLGIGNEKTQQRELHLANRCP